MALWRKPLQFINVMLANRSPMSVAERGPGRMTYAKKKKNPLQNTTCASRFTAQVKIKPFAEHDLRFTLQRAGKNQKKNKHHTSRVNRERKYSLEIHPQMV